MDEGIKVYEPGTLVYDPYSGARFRIYHNDLVDELKKFDDELKAQVNKENKHPSHTKESKWKFFFDWDIWKDVIIENAQREAELNKKHPWVEILHRWVIAICIGLLFIGFGIWGINIHTERTAEQYGQTVAAQKDAEHQAYLAQQEADRKAAEESLENQMIARAQIEAQLGYGSKNFIEKYHYGDSDFETLYQCFRNRMKNPIYEGMTMEEIAFQEGQFVGAYDTNPIQDYFFNLAMRFERANQNRVSEPVGSDYIYAVYTPHGIYLTNDIKAPEYTWWHYSE